MTGVLEQVWKVIGETTTLSWFGFVLMNIGEGAAGMIEADEWQSLFTIYIPITLISLWGSPTTDSKLKATLNHTMDLVSVVYTSCSHTMTIEHATTYHWYTASYIGRLKHIYPGSNLKPNHHAAFHVYDILVLFGPVYSWWTFLFECLIGALQRFPSNHKFGMLQHLVGN